MSLLPLILELSDIRPFGYVVYPEQIQHPRHCHQQSLNACSRPNCKQLRPQHNRSNCTKLTNLHKNFEKDGFQVSLDAEGFAPNEISVKTVDNTIVVEGKHEEKEDEHGFISRHFIRKYTLPKEVDVNDVVSSLSTDGRLTVKAPPKPKAAELKERVIQIQQTGEAHRKIKETETLVQTK